ncbi:STAS domain-containing protein [Spongisporangium articulatum]|uniref:Anti-sigma factor antagonist n=1 Tax=Spongisporangium articulatum TaxID=3362603 RepID=A0ABW8AIY6_9ACTN
MELNVMTRQEGVRTVVSVAGEIDVYTAPSLRERLAELDAQGVSDIVVDMGAVEFLDSTGLGVLVGGLKRARARGGTLRLVSDQEKILKILRITGLVQVFPIHATLADALLAEEPADGDERTIDLTGEPGADLPGSGA